MRERERGGKAERAKRREREGDEEGGMSTSFGKSMCTCNLLQRKAGREGRGERGEGRRNRWR